MIEGWVNDEYLILFSETEVPLASERYAISRYLDGYQVVGLRSWDDLIVRDSSGRTFTVPTVPLEIGRCTPFRVPGPPLALQPDDRYARTIKWYVQPIVFGGSAEIGENMIWVDHAQHSQLVTWWNKRYREAANR